MDGICFPSKMEAAVFVRLREECAATGASLYRQVRIPLLSISPKGGKDRLKPHVFTCDFYIGYVAGGGRYEEAKSKRRSRDYELRKAAAEYVKNRKKHKNNLKSKIPPVLKNL